MLEEFLFIAGRPETFPPYLFEHDPNLLPLMESEGTNEMIVGRPETWPFGTFDEDPNRHAPTLTSLSPASTVLGEPDFTLHVMGSGFTPESVIVFANQPEPTTFVSPTEVTTGVNMAVWHGPDTVQVQVRAANGLPSASLPFTFADAPEVRSKRR